MGTELQKVEQRRKVVIGDNTLAIVDEKGGEQLVASKVKVSERDGSLYNIKGKFKLTAEGYDRLNAIAGLSTIMPPTLIDQGQEHRNPYRKTNRMGEVEEVVVRVLAVGRAPLGKPVMVDQTVTINVAEYLRVEWQQMLHKKPGCGKLITRDQFDAMTPDEKVGHLYVPLHHTGVQELGAWMDLSHDEVTYKLSELLNFTKFVERRANTIARRQALRKHPAIAASTVEVSNGKGHVVVYGWTDIEGKSHQKMLQMADDYARTGKAEAEVLESMHVSAKEDIDDSTSDEEVQARDEVITSQRPEDAPNSSEAKNPPQGTSETETPPSKPAQPEEGKADDVRLRLIEEIPKAAGRGGKRKERIRDAITQINVDGSLDGITNIEALNTEQLDKVLVLVTEAFEADKAAREAKGKAREEKKSSEPVHEGPPPLGEPAPEDPPAKEPDPEDVTIARMKLADMANSKNGIGHRLFFQACAKLNVQQVRDGGEGTIEKHILQAIDECDIKIQDETRPLKGCTTEQLVRVVDAFSSLVTKNEADELHRIGTDLAANAGGGFV